MMVREKALRGETRALERLLELAARFNNDPAEAVPAQPLPADDQAILAAYRAECAAAPMTQPSTEPSPDPVTTPGAGTGTGKKSPK